MDFDRELLLDGAMGSLLVERMGYSGEPSDLNIDCPKIIADVHREYREAGAEAVLTNTFGANPFKSGRFVESIRAGIELARGSGAAVGLDVGPTGKILGPGGITFEEAYESFKSVARVGEGADFVMLETFSDLNELRAAILAFKENSRLPVAASMTFEKNGRTFLGCPASAFALTVSGLKADAIGINCTLGPREAVGVIEEMMRFTPLPVFARPNAGQPVITDRGPRYELTPKRFFEEASYLREAGVKIIGGCCGTSPEHIRLLKALPPAEKRKPKYTGAVFCSALSTLTLNEPLLIGERINPTGKPALKAAVEEGDFDYICSMAIRQEESGADMLDINVAISGSPEAENLRRAVEAVSAVCPLPLCIDSSDPKALEAALRIYPGRALINSVNGSKKSLNEVLPLAAKYGAGVIGLCINEDGIPENARIRVEIAQKILCACEKAGIDRDSVFIDALTMAAASDANAPQVTLEAVKKLSEAKINTVLGISNVSHGMPARHDINAAFLSLARNAGLTAYIMNPDHKGYSATEKAVDFVQKKRSAAEYIEYAAGFSVPKEFENQDGLTLCRAVLTGRKTEAAALTQELLKESAPHSVMQSQIIPALDRAGELYGQGKMFLPQLIAAAEAARSALKTIESRFKKSADGPAVVLATVRGDVHDIGKNIVKAVVGNYGYRVIDLGRDVPKEKIIEAAAKYSPIAVGLSALMTTTAAALKETALALHKAFPSLPVLAGGAVITEEFASSAGCKYCAAAPDTVRALKEIERVK